MAIKIIEPSIKIYPVKTYEELLGNLERIGRVCYKSEDKITKESAEKFITHLLSMGHESVIEHENISARIICDRGVSHEIVRHRLASYSQESTRYVNYNKKDVEFIKPCFWNVEESLYNYNIWENFIKHSAEIYIKLIENGCSPQEARSVLPNSLKTELVMTCNLREWRHFLKLRCSKKAHPQMREIALKLLNELYKYAPIIFQDIYGEYYVIR